MKSSNSTVENIRIEIDTKEMILQCNTHRCVHHGKSFFYASFHVTSEIKISNWPIVTYIVSSFPNFSTKIFRTIFRRNHV